MADLQQMLKQILHEPLSYIHEARLRLPPMLNGAPQSIIINEMLINRLHLSTEPPQITAGSTVLQGVLNWQHLPRTGFLISCQRMRASLARQGGLQRLPAWAQPFARLDLIPPQPSLNGETISFTDLIKQSYLELYACLGPLPPALKQRLALLFPPFVDTIKAQSPLAPAYPLLFNQALQYAQRHPHPPAYNGPGKRAAHPQQTRAAA
ncbi:type III secretion apparatus protein OrgA/MxiK [Iodobacter ciconiae]|uniref:Type III secretion apparatus protein OrgA/MxiK n=1 Tax=Iodobacter ciconiae TaxID=2496266 RepID=A0A3S8ZR64_9NEIS|nr:type III secretion apparatus protein OrgA/MxiK [Iodobacter ciconiae]AZN35911.1 type III secretion apparatus protein OrgA/MxiK [Iodobacter ciconiae]